MYLKEDLELVALANQRPLLSSVVHSHLQELASEVHTWITTLLNLSALFEIKREKIYALCVRG